MVKLVSITPFDIQSWSGREELLLSPSRVTVLKAPSETGKSVLTNFLTDFCKPDYDKDIFKAIVRRGCTSGGVVFKYDDGSSLVMIMREDAKHMGYFEKDREPVMYCNDEINEISLEKFGLIVDVRNNILINVFSRNNPLLFVDTDELFNGSLLTRVLIDRNVERVQDYLKQLEDLLKVSLKDATSVKDKLEFQEHTLIYSDTSTMSTDLQSIKEYKDFCNKAYSIEKRMEELDKYPAIKFIISDGEVNSLIKLKSIVEAMDSISIMTSRLSDLKLLPKVDCPDVLEMIKGLNYLESLTYSLNSLDRLSRVELPGDLFVSDVMCKSIVLPHVDFIFKELETLCSLDLCRQVVAQNLVEQEKELEDLKLTLQICPLCGNNL